MALKITEEWVKERIKLDHDKLEDVKSLALPGSYHEKIGSLSTALSNFSRLQQLDVSRNAISSLDGIGHLKYLENLNLYYNSIPDLKEVFKLRKNQALKVLDLRLNPVTKTEPDYRLFVVHMLPLLRQLDDRPVRDSERKAALMHFSNEQATDMVFKDPDEEEIPVKSGEYRASSQPRAEYVRNMVKKPTFVVEDDTCMDVIDLMNRNGGDIRNEIPPTGGVTKQPEAQEHTHDELVRLAKKDDPAAFRERLGSFEDVQIFLNGEEMAGNAEVPSRKPNDSHLMRKLASIRGKGGPDFSTDDDAYTKYKSIANFTRHPGNAGPPPTAARSCSDINGGPNDYNSVTSATPESLRDEYARLPNVKRLSFGDSETSKLDESNVARCSVQAKFIDEFLDIVDRYWNGTKSLHYHKKFRSLIEKPLSKYEGGLASAKDVDFQTLEDKIATLTKENKNLHMKVHALSKQRPSSAQEGTSHADQEALRSRLQLSMSDNKILRNKISELEDKVREKNDEKANQEHGQLVEVEQQKRSLVQQVANLKFQLKNYASLDDLTKMLQDSHKSLISTNDRLLSELDETRSRHHGEIEQLKWSYDQLRKTNQLVTSTATMNGTEKDSQYMNGY